MNFLNDKKTFLAKLDKSKKGEVDEKVVPLLKKINYLENYYTTSSCSGRVYLWKGSGKKNETEWLKISHDLVDDKFFQLEGRERKGLIWLRVEPLILHVCCRSLEAASRLLERARKIFKKSCLLSVGHKIIVEVRGSEFIEMPLYKGGELLFKGELTYLAELVNQKLRKIFERINQFNKIIK